jgi:DNA polymerase
VAAAAQQLPRALEKLGEALALPVQKDKEGTRLIRKFSIPRKPKKGESPLALLWNEPEDHPEDFEKFHNYCDDDVRTECAAKARLVPQSVEETLNYHISERINDRGLRTDRTSVRAAIRLAEKAKKLINREMRLVTGGYVGAASEVGKLKEWIESQGVAVPTLGKDILEELLEREDLPDNVRKAVALRQEFAKTSVAKLKAFMKRVSADGRIRGAFLFHAAGTGRFSSVGAQLHNLPRPRKAFGKAGINMQVLFQFIRMEDPELLKAMYGDELGRTLHLISDAIRGFIWAAPGKELLVADYSGIEGAVAAWVCDEAWKLQAMFDIINDPNLPDLYRRAAAGIFNTTTDILTKDDGRRQVGKVSELSMQYQGGVGAFRSMAKNYSLKLDEVYTPVWAAASEADREGAEKRHEECKARGEALALEMSREAWLAAELVKVGWRRSHPAISESWKLLESAVWDAVTSANQLQTAGATYEEVRLSAAYAENSGCRRPGTVVQCLKVKYVVRKSFLWCLLPSGRCLAYGKPEIRDIEVPWSDKTQPARLREKKATVTALSVNSVTKRWERSALYGGLLLENIVQAIARDLMCVGIQKAESAGYPVIGHVHDEIITEVPRGWGDVHAFEALICEKPDWANALPLVAEGWRGKRYRK